MKTKVFSRAVKTILSGGSRIHFSQYGEDVLLHKRFRKFDTQFFYIDIGAHHPYHLSNTAYLWTLGWNGVNVDASSAVVAAFNSSRPNDLNIHAAVVSEETASTTPTVTFYSSKDIDNCATCDPDVAQERGLTHSHTVPCTSLTAIVEQAHARFAGRFGFLNIDIEGLDDQVIQNIQAWPQKPQIVMIEIYGATVANVLASRTCQLLERVGYGFTERIGHTAVFELASA